VSHMICQIRNLARPASLREQIGATAGCDYNVPAGNDTFCWHHLSFYSHVISWICRNLGDHIWSP